MTRIDLAVPTPDGTCPATLHVPDSGGPRLEAALVAAGVRYTMDTYPAEHGFAVPDDPTFDADADERHWADTARVFGEALG